MECYSSFPTLSARFIISACSLSAYIIKVCKLCIISIGLWYYQADILRHIFKHTKSSRQFAAELFVRYFVFYQSKMQIIPPEPSFTIFSIVPRNLSLTSSGILVSLIRRSSSINSPTLLPKIL